MSHRVSIFAALAAAALLIAGPGAWAQSAIPARTADPALVRMQERIDELEAQTRALTGEKERLTFEVGQLKDRVDRLEKRVADLLAASETAPSSAQAPAPAPPQRQAAAAPPAAQPAQPAQASTAGGEAASAFQAAKALLDAGDFGGAEAAFSQFIDTYPRDARFAEARYWRGRTLLARGANREGAQDFFDVIRNAAKADVAPDALVYLGVALNRMGENGRACQAFGDLDRLYPRAPATTKALAQREARNARCAA